MRHRTSGRPGSSEADLPGAARISGVPTPRRSLPEFHEVALVAPLRGPVTWSVRLVVTRIRWAVSKSRHSRLATAWWRRQLCANVNRAYRLWVQRLRACSAMDVSGERGLWMSSQRRRELRLPHLVFGLVSGLA